MNKMDRFRKWVSKTLKTPAFWLGAATMAVAGVAVFLLTKLFTIVGLFLCAMIVVVIVVWSLRRKVRQPQAYEEGGQQP